MMNKGLNAYKRVGVQDQLSTADPHRVIQMLMQGAIDRMSQARGAIERKDYAAKAQHVSKALAIVSALKDSLRPVPGGEEVSGNLAALYDFVMEQLSEVSVNNDVKLLVDSASIITTLKEGWDAIPQDARTEAFQTQSEQPAASASGY